jgi:hypothetical protein
MPDVLLLAVLWIVGTSHAFCAFYRHFDKDACATPSPYVGAAFPVCYRRVGNRAAGKSAA